MNFAAAALALCFCFGSAFSLRATEPQVRHKEPLPQIQPVAIPDPVPVPETIGATVVAGVGFLLMFRRRRYA